MKKLVFDTNVILRFLLNDIPSQRRKVESLIKEARGKKLLIIIPEVVVFESFFTLKTYYGYEKDILLSIVESLVSAEYFKIESNSVFMEAVKIYRVTSLEFVDCFLIAKSQLLESDLFTFDKKLLKNAK